MYRQRLNCKITQSIYDEESHYDGEHVTILKEQEKRITDKLLLNVMFMAEKDASKTSTYRIEADGEAVGRFKSSGVIVSTGTGSSGWLYGARRVTTKNISEISKALLEKEDQSEPLEEHVKEQLLHALDDPEYTESVAQAMSSDTHFEPELKNMYYYVREPYTGTQFSEGFAQHMKLHSELCDGQICIDGSNKYHMTHGDTCEVDIKPEYRLKCFKFVK